MTWWKERLSDWGSSFRLEVDGVLSLPRKKVPMSTPGRFTRSRMTYGQRGRRDPELAVEVEGEDHCLLLLGT